MNKYRKTPAILALVIAMTLASACSNSFDQADKIIYGGTIVTVDDSNPRAEAIAIKDGKIVAVGSESKVMAWRGDGCRAQKFYRDHGIGNTAMLHTLLIRIT